LNCQRSWGHLVTRLVLSRTFKFAAMNSGQLDLKNCALHSRVLLPATVARAGLARFFRKSKKEKPIGHLASSGLPPRSEPWPRLPGVVQKGGDPYDENSAKKLVLNTQGTPRLSSLGRGQLLVGHYFTYRILLLELQASSSSLTLSDWKQNAQANSPSHSIDIDGLCRSGPSGFGACPGGRRIGAEEAPAPCAEAAEGCDPRGESRDEPGQEGRQLSSARR